MNKDFEAVFEKEAKKGELFSSEKIQSQLEKDTDSLMSLLRKSKDSSKQMKMENNDQDRIVEYFQDKKRFSDLFNGFMSSSGYRLDPNDLIIQEPEKENSSEVMMADGNCSFLLRLIPDEEEIYDLVADASFISQLQNYLGQIENGASKVKPVIELVLYLGDEPYNGPESMADIFEKSDERTVPFVSKNKLNLIDPYKLTNEELENYSEELQNMFRKIRGE